MTAWFVIAQINFVGEQSQALISQFDLPWDPTRTGRKYVYLAVCLFGIGAIWFLLARVAVIRNRLSFLPRLSINATILLAIALSAAAVAYELQLPGWSTTIWSIGSDDDLMALRRDPYVHFSPNSENLVVRVHSNEGMESQLRALARVGYSGASDFADELRSEGDNRRSRAIWFSVVSVASLLLATFITIRYWRHSDDRSDGTKEQRASSSNAPQRAPVHDDLAPLPERESRLIAAVYEQDYDAVESVLSAGADINLVDHQGFCAKDYARMRGGKIWRLIDAYDKQGK